MSLEEEAWKTTGPPAAPSPARPPTVGDRIARIAAALVLLLIATFSAWVFSLILPRAVSIPLVGAGLLLVVVLLFKTRELRARLQAAEQELATRREEQERAAEPPPERPQEPREGDASSPEATPPNLERLEE